jgi:DNA modification methylase
VRAGVSGELLGFSDEELAKILVEVDVLGECDEDETPAAPKDPKSKTGDIYYLGSHRLVCGDSTSIDAVKALMGEVKADMIWTDPPYNVAYEGKTKEALTIKNDSMGDDTFYQFLFDAYTNMLMYTKGGGAIYVAHADSEGANFRQALKNSGFLLKQCIIWLKNTIVMGRQDYHWKHEPILYGWAPGASHNWYSDRKQSTVFECKKPRRNGEHPTMKPVELMEYFINNSSLQGQVVMDLFGGSGSTLIACEKTNRKCYTMELDPKYCDVIVSRYVKFSGNSKIIRNGEECEWNKDE